MLRMLTTVSRPISPATSTLSRAAVANRKKTVKTVAIRQRMAALIYSLVRKNLIRKNLIRKMRLLAISVRALVAR